jgi:uncharacterized protein (TIGR03437 family)
MIKVIRKFAPFLIVALAVLAILTPSVRTQNLGVTVRISAVPSGPFYMVDGVNYTQPFAAVWPVGTKHTLSVQSMVQEVGGTNVRYTFQNWMAGTTPLPGGNVVTLTADPALSTITANFQAQYALNLIFNPCTESVYCTSAGTIYIGTSGYQSNQQMWFTSGATTTLLAVPKPGYVFTGWLPGTGQVIQGPLNTVTLSGPVSVYPIFQVARKINVDSIPSGLNVYADRSPVPTPSTLEWGWDSTHSVGAITPQMDNHGVWWVFSSWSDGGATTHAYTVQGSNMPAGLTAKYVRGVAVQLTTLPAGLKLSVDGRDNWPSTTFVWGGGEKHRVQAPATQTDAQGRIWKFSSWSNGGAAAQDINVPADAATADLGMRMVATYTSMGHLTIHSSLGGTTVTVDGAECATPCEVERPAGATVRVGAPPAVSIGEGTRGDFTGWPGSGSTAAEWTYTLNGEPLTVSADYRIMNRLAAASNPPEGATWRLQPASADGFYETATNVMVTVSAKAGFRFKGWSGDLSGNKPAGVVAMNAPRAVEAQLERIPYISPAGVVNAAGVTPAAGVAAGSVVSIFGASLAPALTVGPQAPLAQVLGGVAVRLGDRVLPLFFVSPEQINAQIPDDLEPGPLSLTVNVEGMPDVQAAVKIVRNAPGLFQQEVAKQQFAMAFHEDGTAVTPDAPAAPGEAITIYGTGFGPADHVRPMGFAVPSEPPYVVTDAAFVRVGEAVYGAEAFAVAGRIGVDAVRFRIGDDAPAGTNASLYISINGQDSNTVLLPAK